MVTYEEEVVGAFSESVEWGRRSFGATFRRPRISTVERLCLKHARTIANQPPRPGSAHSCAGLRCHTATLDPGEFVNLSRHHRVGSDSGIPLILFGRWGINLATRIPPLLTPLPRPKERILVFSSTPFLAVVRRIPAFVTSTRVRPRAPSPKSAPESDEWLQSAGSIQEEYH